MGPHIFLNAMEGDLLTYHHDGVVEVRIGPGGGSNMVAGVLLGSKASRGVCRHLKQVCAVFRRVELMDSSSSGKFGLCGLEKSVAD